MKRDPLIIGVASVLVIAFTLSLLNIYVFPNLFFNIDVARYADNEFQEGLLIDAEKFSFKSDIFEGINFSQITTDSPENSILNISLMIELALDKHSAAFDQQEDLMPRRIKLQYNGTIVGFNNQSQSYENWIEDNYDSLLPYTYFAFKNSAENYEVYTNFTHDDLDYFTFDYVLESLDEVMTTENIQPDYVIYQTMEYSESRGMFNEYSTEFKRIIFTDTFGEILFFLTTEGEWTKPLVF